MNPLALVALLRTRAELGSHERWSPAQLEAHQASGLAALRAYAYARSPYYREFHRGLEAAPLAELPVLTKSALMDDFDAVVTDREVRRAEVEDHLAAASATDMFHGRYRVAATGGTSGRRGIFLADPGEWNMILASYSRAYAWAGLEVGLTHPLRMAIVSSRVPTHQSSIVGATVRNPLMPTLRLDATAPVPETVGALNAFRPRALVGYASMLAVLAHEQQAGRLTIAPRAVFSASEVLTPDIRAAAANAWGDEPYNVYAATETAGLASECRQHHLHRYADLVIAESVDAENQSVPEGQPGAKLLVTVLFSRTQPLIRYELTDRVRISTVTATDLGPFSSLIEAVEGRTEDVLALPAAAGGTVQIHPNLFHTVLEAADAPWQVIRYPDRLQILVAGPVEPALQLKVERALAAAGAAPLPMAIERVAAIPRTALGKAPLVRVASS